MNDNMISVFAIVKEYFKSNGFDELYEETKQLSQAVQGDATTDRTEKVACERESYVSHWYLKTSVKADVFNFDVSDASDNLKLFINVLDKLGVWLENDALYEEYQKIYDKTVIRSIRQDKKQEMMWNRDM